MSGDEILPEVTSQRLESENSSETTVDAMLEQFEDEVKDEKRVENPKRIESECKGNILTECMREGLKELEEATEETGTRYVIIGGIATQLRGLADHGDIITIGDHFGQRQTADIDILVEDYGDGLAVQRAYDETNVPNLDLVYSHIPGDEEMIENGELVDYSEVVDGFDFKVRIPTNEDLIYSKVWHPSLEKKEGTRYDLDKHAELSGYVFNVDESKLRDTIKRRAPDMEASIDYLMRAGIDV